MNQTNENQTACDIFDKLAENGSLPVRRISQLLDMDASKVIATVRDSDWFHYNSHTKEVAIAMKN